MAIALRPGQDPDGDWRWRFWRTILRLEIKTLERVLVWTNRLPGGYRAPWRPWLISARVARIKRWHRGLL